MPRGRSSAGNINLRPSDDLFEPTVAQPQGEVLQFTPQQQYPSELSLDELHPFPNHPFEVRQDEALLKLARSIAENGMAQKILCRPAPDGNGYQIIAGHRRHEASRLAGIMTVPVEVESMSDEMATILMVDTNLKAREEILPSEKARAYTMKVEAIHRERTAGDALLRMRHIPDEQQLALFELVEKGSLTEARELVAGWGGFDAGEVRLIVAAASFQGRRATEIAGEEFGENYRSVIRYLRLNHLQKPLLDLVDDKKIKMHVGVELSYLKPQEQYLVHVFFLDTKKLPTLEQAKQFKSISSNRPLTIDDVESVILSGIVPSQKITLTLDELRDFFPHDYSVEQIKENILRMLENRSRSHEMQR